MTRKGREYIMPFKISNAKRTAQQMAMRKAKTRQQKKPRFSATPAFKPTKADDRGYAGGGRARYIGAGSQGGPNTPIRPVKPKGKGKIKGTFSGPMTAFKPTKADDRGYRKGGVGKFRTGYRKGGVGKFRSDLDGDMSGRTGYSAGGSTLAKMRKNIIGIKKDRGLTAKSGARTGMTKKRATGRGGR